MNGVKRKVWLRRGMAYMLAMALVLIPAGTSLAQASETTTTTEASDAAVQAESIEAATVKTGSCGKNARYTYNSSTKTLTISGSGAMKDYADSEVPWDTYASDIKKVVISYGVTSIGDAAFYYCSNLSEVSIANSVKKIGAYAFFECGNLKSVTIPGSVKTIKASAFRGCKLKKVTIPASVTSIGAQAFSCTSLKSFTVSKKNKKFSAKDGVLYNKKKTKLIEYPASKKAKSFKMPNTVKTMEKYAFEDCKKLKSVKLSTKLKEIPEGAFYGSALTSIKFGKSVKKIGAGAFESTNLKSVTIPNQVEKIGARAFEDCENLKSIVIGSGVTKIGYNAFLYTGSGALSIKFKGSAPKINSSAFEDTTATVKYPSDDSSWTSSKLVNYGGTLTWVAY